MEFKQLVKTRSRMCFNYMDFKHLGCRDCPLNKLVEEYPTGLFDLDCMSIIFSLPAKAEKIISDWLKENPEITNKRKFLVTYKNSPWKDYAGCGGCYVDLCPRVGKVPCNYCSWWNEECE